MTGNQRTFSPVIEEDVIVENNEILTAYLSSQDPSVDVLVPMQQILVIDNDGKLG